MARDILVSLLQGLGFIINIKKSILQSDDEIHFTTLKSSGFDKIVSRDSPSGKSVTLWKLTSLIGSPCSAAKVELPAFFQVRYLQEQQIKTSSLRCSYQTLMHLISNSVEELKRWVNNLELSDSRAIVHHLPQLTIQTDASKKGWEAFCKGVPVGDSGINRSQLCT